MDVGTGVDEVTVDENVEVGRMEVVDPENEIRVVVGFDKIEVVGTGMKVTEDESTGNDVLLGIGVDKITVDEDVDTTSEVVGRMEVVNSVMKVDVDVDGGVKVV